MSPELKSEVVNFGNELCNVALAGEMLIFQILFTIGKLFSIPSIEQGLFCSVR